MLTAAFRHSLALLRCSCVLVMAALLVRRLRAAVSLVSVPGLWRGGTSYGDSSGDRSSTGPHSHSAAGNSVGSVPSSVGVLSGCVCLLWCALSGRRWSLYRLRGVLSSDLFTAGSFGRRALPASRGAEYANEGEKRALQSLGDQYGCHHCGRHIATHKQRREAMMLQRAHMRPSQLEHEHVLQPFKASTSRGSNNSRIAGAADVPAVLGFIGDHIPPSGLHRTSWLRRPAPQLFYPQCPPCSAKQSQAVRLKRRTLVIPYWRRFTWSDLYPPPLLLMLCCVPALQQIVNRAEMLAV